MALWGTTVTADEAKPKHLTAEQKKTVYATDRGWVQLNGKGLEEVLVSIGGLAGGTSSTAGLGKATVDFVDFVTTSYGHVAGGTIDVRVTYNEKVTVVTTGGTPSIVVTNDQTGSGTDGTFTAAYLSGTGTNRLVFRKTYSAGDGGVELNDVLNVAAQNIILNSGTIKDAGTTLDSLVAIPAGTGTLKVAA